ncbi:MAG: thiopurine S-methyltransferase [Pseudomonadota bacterium]|nr:thiopurine S-methyltransferase [Pseudomonadota bacterium]
MKANFWHGMWASGVVGFHQSDINEFLQNHWKQLNLAGDEAVLVPLCGKSLDMLWLQQQGHEVLGVELSQRALDEFLVENSISAKPVKHDQFCGYELEAMTLLCGDFFKLSAEDCSQIKAVYDRASIVALPPEMRKAYVEHLQIILPQGAKILMVTMEYDQSLMSGPPFSVTEKEVRDLFMDFASIDKVSEISASRKGNAMLEKVFVIQT